MRIYLSNQNTFGNRGCEAIVRSTVAAFRAAAPGAEFLVPSSDPARDAGQWPEARDLGVRFVRAFMPWQASYWVRLQALPLPGIQSVVWPFPIPREIREDVASADLVLSIGGDNYSLDYRLPTYIMAVDRLAMSLGKPVHLWGASVGPFEAQPRFVPTMRAHLARMTGIHVRETISRGYLTETLGLSNVSLMSDPAFILAPDDTASVALPRDGGAGLLGLNVSPLIERYRRDDQSIGEEVSAFVRKAVGRGYGVVLIPHVTPLGGTGKNNDHAYMQREILERCPDLEDSVVLLPDGMNAVALKSVLGRMRFFVGARTHATIGAMSSGVPTISIAYSVKAKGINRDLLPDRDVVLPTPELSCASLLDRLDCLERDETALRAELPVSVDAARAAVHAAATGIMTV